MHADTPESKPPIPGAAPAARPRRRPRWRYAAFAFLGLVAALVAAVAWFMHLGRPVRSGERSIAGLGANVEVYFDDAAVPHVFARSESDIARAIGYLHASERLTQLELGRRFAHGRLAEILGPALVDVDVRSRRLGFMAAAAASMPRLSDRSRVLLDAYAEGVNGRLRERDMPPMLRLLGVVPEPWSPEDSLGFAALMAYELSAPLDQEFWRARLHGALGAAVVELFGWDGLDTGGSEAAIATRFPNGFGGSDATEGGGQSNNWAVGAARSATGSALLAGDPHLSLGLPPRWYQARLSSPEYDVQGFTLPGVPVVIVGQSALRAWSVTTTGLDGEDSFVEDYDPATFTVLRGDTRVAVVRRTETIGVSGGNSVEFELLSTDLGPLLPADVDGGLPWRSLAWTLYAPADPLELFTALASAPRLEDVLTAAESYVAPAQNLAIAEASGRVAYTVVGRAPVRGRGDGRLPAPAWDSSFHWRGLESAAANPRVVDPADGVVATANADVRPDDYRGAFTADFAHPSRRDRLYGALRARDDWNVADFAALQLDVRSPYALAVVAALGEPRDFAGAAGAKDALLILAPWDGEVRGGPAAALFHFVVRELAVGVWEKLHPDQPVGFGVLRDALPRWLSASPGGGPSALGVDHETVIGAALARAWSATQARLGPDPRTWRSEDLQQLQLDHPLVDVPILGRWLSRGPFGFAGHNSTVNVSWSRWRGDSIEVAGAASLRFVADTVDPDRSLGILPGGQSGHPFDPHYDDQLPLWLAGEMRPMAFSRAAVQRVQRSHLVLTPQ